MSIRPLYDRIVVRRLEAESTSKGGIVIPNSAAEKPNRGEIVAAGPGVALDNGEIRPLSVAVGDVVLFGKYTSNEIEIDGEELLILRESDLLAVIEQSKKVEKAA